MGSIRKNSQAHNLKLPPNQPNIFPAAMNHEPQIQPPIAKTPSLITLKATTIIHQKPKTSTPHPQK
jgi:hypothetical protein